MITSLLLVLIVTPVGLHLAARTQPREALESRTKVMQSKGLSSILLLMVMFVLGCSQQAPVSESSKKTAGTTTAEKPILRFVAEPHPSKRGKPSTLIVELTEANGHIIGNAEVKAVFVMSMGSMGDMREKTSLKWAGDQYEGTFIPPMAGTWQVSVEALKHGQIIASYSGTVTAK